MEPRTRVNMYSLRKVPFEGINLTGTLFYFEQGLLSHFITMSIYEAEELLCKLLRQKRVTTINTRLFEIINNYGEVVRTFDAFQLVKMVNERVLQTVKHQHEGDSSEIDFS